MARFGNVEALAKPGEYLMKIVRCEEKKSQNGKTYFSIDFESNDGVRISYETFMLEGKMANRTIQLLKAIGRIENDEDYKKLGDISENDFLGHYLYVEAVKDKEKSQYLKAEMFDGFRPYESNSSLQQKKQEIKQDSSDDLIGDDEIPF